MVPALSKLCTPPVFDVKALMSRIFRKILLRFCIVYCSQGNREQPAHYLKQNKNVGKRFGVYGALFPVHTETLSCVFVLFTVLKEIENNQLIS